MQSKNMATIISELDTYSVGVSEEDVDNLAQLIVKSNRIFIAGAGRSGFAAKGFANRLMHLNLEAHFVGGPTTPSIQPGDLLIIGSGSGSTSSLVANAKKAKNAGAKLATVTIYPTATIGSLADVIVTVPGETPKNDSGAADTASSVQPMGSLFEQLSWLTYDAVVLQLMGLLHETTDTMFPRHANLE